MMIRVGDKIRVSHERKWSRRATMSSLAIRSALPRAKSERRKSLSISRWNEVSQVHFRRVCRRQQVVRDSRNRPFTSSQRETRFSCRDWKR